MGGANHAVASIEDQRAELREDHEEHGDAEEGEDGRDEPRRARGVDVAVADHGHGDRQEVERVGLRHVIAAGPRAIIQHASKKIEQVYPERRLHARHLVPQGLFLLLRRAVVVIHGAAEKGDDSVHEEGAFEAAVVVRVHVVMKLRLRPELVEFY